MASSKTPAAQTVLVSTGSVWRYFAAGTQAATGWQSPGFDDSTWALGPAELGFGDGDENTVIPPVTTAYFRSTFSVANPADLSSVFADVWRDDGVIVYINGTEVFRDNMPPDPPTYRTLAEATALDDGDIPIRGNISPAALVAGINTIAVEVHQSSFTSTDMSFDLMLAADIVTMNLPPTANNQSLVALQNTPTPIVLSGSDPEGNPLTYVLTSSPAHGTLSGTAPNLMYRSAADYAGPDSFTFKVNDGAADSPDATVSIQVLAPPDPPEIVGAVGECGSPRVVVTFDEPLDPVSATDVFNYLVVDSSRNPLAVISASLAADQRTVTLMLDHPLNAVTAYTLEVVSICDLSGDCLEHAVVPVRVESHPVVLACDVAVDLLWPPNHEASDVGLSATSSEPVQVQVFSDEPDGGGDAVFAHGLLQLRSQREGKSDGRVYLIVITSMDACGNLAVCCRTVVGPHDSSQDALDSVKAQAASAQAQCSPAGSAVTPYRLLP